MTRGWQTSGRVNRSDRRRKKVRPARQPGQGAPTSGDQAPATSVPARPVASRPSTSSGWRAAPAARAAASATIHPEDYTYVYHDLRRIALLAGCIFVVLIALSFVIK